MGLSVKPMVSVHPGLWTFGLVLLMPNDNEDDIIGCSRTVPPEIGWRCFAAVEMIDKETIGKLAQWRVTYKGKAYSMVSDCFEIRIWTW